MLIFSTANSTLGSNTQDRCFYKSKEQLVGENTNVQRVINWSLRTLIHTENPELSLIVINVGNRLIVNRDFITVTLQNVNQISIKNVLMFRSTKSWLSSTISNQLKKQFTSTVQSMNSNNVIRKNKFIKQMSTTLIPIQKRTNPLPQKYKSGHILITIYSNF